MSSQISNSKIRSLSSEMSNLAEKIAKLREFGLGEKSDSELHHLLRRAGFNLDGAINQFFEEEKVYLKKSKLKILLLCFYVKAVLIESD